MVSGSWGPVVRSIQTLFGVESVVGKSEGQLLEQFLTRGDDAGAEVAFAALVKLHGPMVWRVCLDFLPNPHDAEDAFQATFLILVRKAGSIRRRDTLGPWLYGVARRVAAHAKASAARRRRLEGQGEETTMPPVPDAERREQIEALHEELGRLPEKDRSVVVLCHLEGMTHAEAARILKCPVGTVSVRAARTRELLRARLTRRGLAFPAVLAGALIEPGSAPAAVPSALVSSTIDAAMQVAAGKSLVAGTVSATVAQLTQGVLKSMTIAKFTMVVTGVLVAGFASTGVGLLAMGTGPDTPAAKAEGQAAAPGSKAERDVEVARAESKFNFKAIRTALLDYTVKNGQRYPGAAIRANGKPVLSWRVALLPYLGQQKLYDRFHTDEPWDSPHNKALLTEMPEVYATTSDRAALPSSTYYQALVGPGTLFEDEGGVPFKSVTDGTSNTLMIVEAAKAVPWTKPEDVTIDKGDVVSKLGGPFPEGFYTATGDGAVRFLNKTIDPELLRFMVTRNGGEVVPHKDLPRPE